MAFKIEDVLVDLEFDLTAVGGPRGTVPEPSSETVQRWQDELHQQAVEASLDLPPNPSPVDVAKAVLAKENRGAIAAAAIDTFARLCGAVEVTNPAKARGAPKTIWQGGCPTRDELAALPARAQSVFCGWLTRSIMDPERKPSATS